MKKSINRGVFNLFDGRTEGQTDTLLGIPMVWMVWPSMVVIFTISESLSTISTMGPS